MAGAGLAPSLGWLAFAAGGRDAGALVVAEAVAFVAIAVLAVRGRLRWPSNGVLAAVVAATIAAGLAAAFSSSISSSVPVLVEWLWLAAVAELVVVAAIGPASVRVLVAGLTIALAGQIAWGFAIWFARGDAGVWQLGTFYFPNAYAGYALLLGAPVLAAAVGSPSGARAAAAGVVAVFVLLAVVFSASRTAVVIEALALAATTALSLGRGVRRVLGRVLLVLAAMAVTGFVLSSPLVFPRGDHGIASSLNRKAGTQATSVAARHDTWLGALREVRSHPVLGTGPGTFGDLLFRDQLPSEWWSRYAHNQFLEELSDGGLVLGATFAAIPIVAVVAGSRRLRESSSSLPLGLVVGVAAAAVHFANDIDWSFPAIPATFVAIAVASSFGHREAGIPGSRCPNWVAGVAAVLGMAVLAGGAASHRLRESTPSTVAAARSRGSLAAALAPWSSAPPRWEAEQLSRLGDKRAAVSLLAKAHRRDPLDLTLLWDRGKLEAGLGRRGAARSTFAQAIALGRRAPMGYVLAAENEMAAGHTDRASARFDEALTVAARQPDVGVRAGVIAYLRDARAQVLGGSGR